MWGDSRERRAPWELVATRGADGTYLTVQAGNGETVAQCSHAFRNDAAAVEIVQNIGKLYGPPATEVRPAAGAAAGQWFVHVDVSLLIKFNTETLMNRGYAEQVAEELRSFFGQR